MIDGIDVDIVVVVVVVVAVCGEDFFGWVISRRFSASLSYSADAATCCGLLPPHSKSSNNDDDDDKSCPCFRLM